MEQQEIKKDNKLQKKRTLRNKCTPSLPTLFQTYGTDKDLNGYSACYHMLFAGKKYSTKLVLEVGIGTMIPGVHSSMLHYALDHYKPGGSLRAWRDYFPNAEIIGFDVQPDTQFSEERIHTFLCNTTNKESVESTMKKIDESEFKVKNKNRLLDIVIDDGSHYYKDQLLTLLHLWPYLKPGGFYVIEDIQTSSLLSSQPLLVGLSCENAPYMFCGLKNNMCVIKKGFLNNTKHF